MGVSIVFHPINPYVPTSHANTRFFTKQTATVKMFGGLGEDLILTPYYPYEEDVIFWHQQAKNCAIF